MHRNLGKLLLPLVVITITSNAMDAGMAAKEEARALYFCVSTQELQLIDKGQALCFGDHDAGEISATRENLKNAMLAHAESHADELTKGLDFLLMHRDEKSDHLEPEQTEAERAFLQVHKKLWNLFPGHSPERRLFLAWTALLQK